MKLSSHLWRSRYGTFFLRWQSAGKDKKRSLGTKDFNVAQMAAYIFGAKMVDPLKLVQLIKSGEKFEEYKLELDGDRVNIETDGTPEDHQRLKEALAVLLSSRSTGSTPPQIPASDQQTRWRLDESIESYLADREGELTKNTLITYRSSFNTLKAGMGPDRPLVEITVSEFVKFRKPLDQDRHPDTVVRDCGAWAQFFDWCISRGRHPGPNPVERPNFTRKMRQGLESKFGRPCNPFNSGDLELLFEPSRYEAIKKPCQFWLPLLALYTGARLNELASIKLSCINEYSPGSWSLKIDDSKTKAGIREIPLHRAIISMGLRRYIDDVVKAYPDATLLFPYLRDAAKNGYGNLPGRDFSKLKNDLKLGEDKVFHSFRKTFVSTLQYNKCPKEYRKTFVGHEADDDVHELYSKADIGPGWLEENVLSYLDFKAALGFEMPVIHYDTGRFDEYFAKMKKMQSVNASDLKARREARRARQLAKRGA